MIESERKEIFSYLISEGFEVEVKVKWPQGKMRSCMSSHFGRRTVVTPEFAKKAGSLDSLKEILTFSVNSSLAGILDTAVSHVEKSRMHEYSIEQKKMMINEMLSQFDVKESGFMIDDGTYLVNMLIPQPYPQGEKYTSGKYGIDVHPYFYSLVSVRSKENFYYSRQGHAFVADDLQEGPVQLDAEAVRRALEELPFPVKVQVYEATECLTREQEMFTNPSTTDEED